MGREQTEKEQNGEDLEWSRKDSKREVVMLGGRCMNDGAIRSSATMRFCTPVLQAYKVTSLNGGTRSLHLLLSLQRNETD